MQNNTLEITTQNRLAKKLTNRAKKALVRAGKIARAENRNAISPANLLRAIFLEKGSLGAAILSDLGFDGKSFPAFSDGQKPGGSAGAENIPASPELKAILAKAYSIARNGNFPYVGTEHLAYALLESGEPEIKKISAANIRKNAREEKGNIPPEGIRQIEQLAEAFFDSGQFPSLAKLANVKELLPRNKKSKSATPFLDKFCADINKEAARKEESIIGREEEIQRIINILGRKEKNNPLLIGDPGVGKTVLVSALAERINANSAPAFLFGKKIMRLDVAQLIAGTGFRGEFESRLKEIIEEITKSKNIILFIDEIHTIVGAGNISGSLDLANIIKPPLARGEVQIIGATTFSEFKKYIEKDAALERRFQPVQIKEPSVEETKKILFGIKQHYELFHNVSISTAAISLAAELGARHIQNRFLPDKAIDILDEAASAIRAKNPVSGYFLAVKKIEAAKAALEKEKEKLVTEENFEKAINIRKKEALLQEQLDISKQKLAETEKARRISLDSKDIIETVARITGIPKGKLEGERSLHLKNTAKILSSKIIGQDEAVAEISKNLLRSHLGLSNSARPLGSFLFLGPTGVGKTLAAETLAREIFGSERALIKINMSELAERHGLSSLIGSPAGYIGYGEGGNLTEKVRKNPYSVVLFDEIEKAHPDISNIFLQILENGILTDAEGTAVDFKNTVIILTSNIGSEEFIGASRMGFASEKSGAAMEEFEGVKSRVLKELNFKLKPELLGRLDRILVFNPLGKKELAEIAWIELGALAERLAKRGLKLAFSKAAAAFIAEKSFDPARGARLIRKNIQELIEDPIAELILEDKVKNNRIKIELRKGEIKFI